MNYEEYNDYELVYLAKESNTDANITGITPAEFNLNGI